MLQNKDRIKQIDAAQAVESRLITNQPVFYVINALPGKTSSCEVQVWLRDVKCDHPPETTCKGVRDPSNAATIFSAYGAARIQAITTQPGLKTQHFALTALIKGVQDLVGEILGPPPLID